MTDCETPPLLVIVGPTAVGKTELSLKLASFFDVEIVSADSRQIYRGMDVGTAKPTPEERLAVTHHLIDVVSPDKTLSLAEYQQLAFTTIEEITSRGHLPVLVGGTGLYVWAVVENWEIPRVPPQPQLRADLEDMVRKEGADYLHQRLAEVDPQAAKSIHPNNVRRVIRAMEVYLVSGTPISAQQKARPPRYRSAIIGLTSSRETLYIRADQRVDQMIAAGLVEETCRLLESGYNLSQPAMSGLGYRQIAEHLAGCYPLDEAIQRIKTATHRLIRQQYTWFGLEDKRIFWLYPPYNIETIVTYIDDFLNGRC